MILTSTDSNLYILDTTKLTSNLEVGLARKGLKKENKLRKIVRRRMPSKNLGNKLRKKGGRKKKVKIANLETNNNLETTPSLTQMFFDSC